MLRLHLKLGQVSSNYMSLLKEPEETQVLDPKPTLLLTLYSCSRGKSHRSAAEGDPRDCTRVLDVTRQDWGPQVPWLDSERPHSCIP